MAAHQAPPSLGFSRQEHWSGLPFPSPMQESEKWSCSVVSDSSRPHGLQPTRLLHPWDSPGKNTGVGCHHLILDSSVTFAYPRVGWITRFLHTPFQIVWVKGRKETKWPTAIGFHVPKWGRPWNQDLIPSKMMFCKLYTHFRAYQKSQECVFVYEASRINMSSSPAMPGLLVSSLLHWEY